jgi:hypothetical protein
VRKVQRGESDALILQRQLEQRQVQAAGVPGCQQRFLDPIGLGRHLVDHDRLGRRPVDEALLEQVRPGQPVLLLRPSLLLIGHRVRRRHDAAADAPARLVGRAEHDPGVLTILSDRHDQPVSKPGHGNSSSIAG